MEELFPTASIMDCIPTLLVCTSLLSVKLVNNPWLFCHISPGHSTSARKPNYDHKLNRPQTPRKVDYPDPGAGLKRRKVQRQNTRSTGNMKMLLRRYPKADYIVGAWERTGRLLGVNFDYNYESALSEGVKLMGKVESGVLHLIFGLALI